MNKSNMNVIRKNNLNLSIKIHKLIIMYYTSWRSVGIRMCKMYIVPKYNLYFTNIFKIIK